MIRLFIPAVAGLFCLAPLGHAQDETAADARREHYEVVWLTCPPTPGEGTLEIEKKNRAGERYCARFYFESNVIVRVTLEGAPRGRRLEVLREITRSKTKDAIDLKLIDKNSGATEYFKEFICEGEDSIKRRYINSLRATRRTMRSFGRRACDPDPQ